MSWPSPSRLTHTVPEIYVFIFRFRIADAMSGSQIVDGLHLRNLESKWYVQTAMAINGDGLCEASIQMGNMVKERRASGNSSF